VIANIAVYILGAIWYHALFGSQTKFANDMDKRDPAWSERNKASKGGPWGFFLVDFVLSALQVCTCIVMMHVLGSNCLCPG